MNKIKAIIVDDEKKSRNILQAMLQNYCPEVQILGLAHSMESAKKMIDKQEPHLVFLDIEMPYGSGFDLLKSVEQIRFEVIFVTGFDHYALKAIKFHALDYLLKPVDIDELILSVEKVEKALAKKQDTQRLEELLLNLQKPSKSARKIAIPTKSDREFVPIKEILYCKADGSCTWFFLQNGRKILSSKNLGEYEKLLPTSNEDYDHRFFRTHYSYLVNLHYIKKYNRHQAYLQMTNGDKISLAQRRKAQFSEILKQINFG